MNTKAVVELAPKPKTVKVAQSAITGKFVSPQYAKTHPKTTVVQTVKKK